MSDKPNLPQSSTKSSSPNGVSSESTCAPESRRDEHNGPLFDDTLRPWIPPGEYTATCTRAGKYTDKRFRRDVAVLDFVVAEGEHAGAKLQRFYALGPRVGRGTVFVREWTTANQGQPPCRRDRLALSKFKSKVFRVRVTTVEKTWDGATHPGALRYSKIGSILELVATNEHVQ